MTSAIIRYLLWIGVLITGNAKRIQFGLPTAWVFHTTGYTFLLLLPELYGGLTRLLGLDHRARENPQSPLTTAHRVVEDMVSENPRYVEYLTPPTLAFLLSYPKFDIYKDPYARIRVMGFGLDAIPHSSTAFALVSMAFDTLAALERRLPHTRWARPLDWAYRHSEVVALGTLATATALYESAEYRIYRKEYAIARGDPSKINMDWSVRDTVFDIFSNTLGGLGAVLRHRRDVPGSER